MPSSIGWSTTPTTRHWVAMPCDTPKMMRLKVVVMQRAAAGPQPRLRGMGTSRATKSKETRAHRSLKQDGNAFLARRSVLRTRFLAKRTECGGAPLLLRLGWEPS